MAYGIRKSDQFVCVCVSHFSTSYMAAWSVSVSVSVFGSGWACHVLWPLPMTMTLSSSARMHRVYARVVGADDVTAEADDSPAMHSISNRLIYQFSIVISCSAYRLLCSARPSHWDYSMGCKCSCQCHVSWPTRWLMSRSAIVRYIWHERH